MHIREANLNDFSEINPILVEVEHYHVALEPDIFNSINEYDFNQFFDFVNNENSVILVAEENEKIEGVLIAVAGEWRALPIFKDGKFVSVQELCVTESARRTGIGKTLMHAAEEWGTSKGINRIQLSVWDRNQDAIAFYESLGYVPYIHNYFKKIQPGEQD